MSENELLNQINKTLKEMQVQERENNDILVELKTNFTNLKEDTDAYKQVVNELKTKSNKDEGAMSFIQKILMFIVAALLSFGVWVVTDLHRLDKEVTKIEQQQIKGKSNENIK